MDICLPFQRGVLSTNTVVENVEMPSTRYIKRSSLQRIYSFQVPCSSILDYHFDSGLSFYVSNPSVLHQSILEFQFSVCLMLRSAEHGGHNIRGSSFTFNESDYPFLTRVTAWTIAKTENSRSKSSSFSFGEPEFVAHFFIITTEPGLRASK